jgi:UDP-glucose 6-dehydrogenase
MASDLTYWEQAAREIASALSTCPDAKPRVVVEKSTVPVHTAEAVTQVLEAADVSNVCRPRRTLVVPPHPCGR